MNRIISALAMLAFLGSISPSTALAVDKMSGGPAMTKKCPKGTSWVSGHLDKKTGKMTKSYCRKGKMPKTM